MHDRSPGWRRSCRRAGGGGGRRAGAALTHPTRHARQTRDAARAVHPPHGLYSRWQGQGALASLFITTTCTFAALAGGAHAGWGCAGAAPVRPRPNTQLPALTRHVPYSPRMASTRAGKARGRWLRCSSPPRARLRPWLAALMRAGGVRGRLLCARDPTRNCQPRRGTCRTAPAWPLLALARREGAGFVVHRHLPVHDRGPGWRRSCRLGVCGGGSGAFWSGASAQATPGTCPTPPSCP